MSKQKLVFINGGKHFWNREKDIIKKLTETFEVMLVINDTGNINYTLPQIEEYAAAIDDLTLIVRDFTSSRSRSLSMLTKDLKALRTILRFKADVIYIESFGSPYFALLSALFLPKRKTTIAILDFKLHAYEQNNFKTSERFFQFIYLRFFRHFQLFSTDQAEMMREAYPKKKVHYIPLYLIGRDLAEGFTKPERKPDHITRFMFFGKIHYYKGVDILIEAANILGRKRKDFRVTIAGHSSDFSKYEAKIEDLELFDLKIYYLEKSEFPELFGESDYFVAPYRTVTQSGPLMIAFNFNNTPIVSDLKGFREHIVNDQNGHIFDLESAESLAEVMDKLLSQDQSERDQINDQLRNYVKTFYDIGKFSSAYQEYFHKITGQ